MAFCRKMAGTPANSGCGGGRVGELLPHLGDQFGDLGLLADSGSDRRRLHVPGLEVVGVLAGLRDGRGDRGQLRVILRLHSGVRPDDQIGLQGGDLLELEAVGQGQHLRGGSAQLVLRPRPGRVGLVAVPIGDPDRRHAESEQGVVLGVPGRDHPDGRRLDDRGAELVRDGDREGVSGRRRTRASWTCCPPTQLASLAEPQAATSRPTARWHRQWRDVPQSGPCGVCWGRDQVGVVNGAFQVWVPAWRAVTVRRCRRSIRAA